MHPCSSTDLFTVWEKSCFILSEKSDIHMIDHLSIADHAFLTHMLTSLSVDEILLLRYVNLSINFSGLPLQVVGRSFLFRINELCFIWIHVADNASRCLLLVMQQGFGLGRCISEERLIICVVCICHSFCRILSSSYLFFFLMWNHFLLLDLLTFVLRNLGRLKIFMVLGISLQNSRRDFFQNFIVQNQGCEL